MKKHLSTIYNSAKRIRKIHLVLLFAFTLLSSVGVMAGLKYLNSEAGPGGGPYTCTWVGGTDTSWETPANWTNCNSSVPGAADSLDFSSAATYGLTLIANKTVVAVNAPSAGAFNQTFNTNGYSFTVNGDLTWQQGTLNLSTSEVTVVGSLELSGGTFNSGNNGNNDGSSVILTGADTTLTAKSDGSTRFNRLFINKTNQANTVTVAQNFGVYRELSVSKGTLNATSKTVSLVNTDAKYHIGLLSNGGTASIEFNTSTGTQYVMADGGIANNIVNINKTAGTVYWNGSATATFVTNSTAGGTLNIQSGKLSFPASAAGVEGKLSCVASSTLTFGGTAVGRMVILRSQTASAMYLENSCSATGNFIDAGYVSSTAAITFARGIDSGSNNNITITAEIANLNRWTGAANNSWDDGGNWSLTHKPAASEVAYFSSTYNVNCNLASTTSAAGIISSDYTGILSTKPVGTNYNLTVTGLTWGSGTLSANGSTITVVYAADLSGGIFSKGTSTFVFSTSDPNTPAWVPGENEYYNLTLSPAGAGWVLYMYGYPIVSNDFSQTNGNIICYGRINARGGVSLANSAGSSYVVVSGTTDQTVSSSAGGAFGSLVFNKSAGTAYIGSNINVSADFKYITGGFDSGIKTITLGSGYNGPTWTPGNVNYYDISIYKGNSGFDQTIVGSANVTHNLSLDQSMVIGGTIYVQGNVVGGSGTLVSSGGFNIILNGTLDQTISSGTVILPTFAVNKASGSVTLTSAVTVAGVNQIAGYTGTLDTTASNFALTVNGAFNWKSGTLTANSSTITLTSNADFSGGTFNALNSTTTFSTASMVTFTPGDSTYNNIIINKTYSWTVAVSGTATIGGNLTLTSGLITGGTINLNGNLQVDSDPGSTTSVVLNGTGTQNISCSTSGAPPVTINKPSGAAVLATDYSTNNSWTYTTAGSFSMGSHTISFIGTGANSNFTPGTVTYSNIVVNKDWSWQAIILGANPVNISGNLTYTHGILNGGSINLEGNLIVGDTATGGGTTAISLTGTGTQTVTTSAGSIPGTTLTIAKPSGKAVFTAATTGILNNNIALTQGTLEFTGGKTYTMTVGKTLTASANTNIYFNGTAGNLVTFDSSNGSTQISMVKPDGVVIGDYVSMNRTIVSGGATWYSTTHFAGTGNTGWTASGSGNIRTVSTTGGNWDAVGAWNEASVPTAADNVFGIPSSGALTINVAAVCRSLNATNYASTLTHAAAITLTIGDATAGAGNVALAFNAGMTYSLASNSSAISFISTSTTVQTVDFASKNTGNTTFSAVGGSWKLTGTWGTSSGSFGTQYITIGNGTLDTNGQTCHLGMVSYSGTARTLILGNSTINVYVSWALSATGQTFNANSSTINMLGASASFAGGGYTYATVQFTGSGAATITGANTFGTLTRTGTAVKTDTLVMPSTTVTVALNVNGSSIANRLQLRSTTIGTASVATVSGAAVSMDNVDIQDITFARTDAGGLDLTSSATKSIGDCGGNSRTGGDGTVTFTTPTTQTFAGTGGSWSDAAKWTSRVPLPQDSARFQAMSAGQTITVDMPRLPDTDFSSATNTPTVLLTTSGLTYTWYGSVKLTGVGTFSCNKAVAVIVRSNASVTNNGKTLSSGNVELYALSSSTITLSGAYICGGQTTLYNGTLASNDDVTTVKMVTASGTILDMGTAATIWTISGSATMWSVVGSVTNGALTTIALTYASTAVHTFQSGTNTYNKITVASGTGVLTFSGAITFNEISMADTSAAKTVLFTGNTTYTFAGTNFLNGVAGKPVTIGAISGTTVPPVINKTSGGKIALDYLNIQGVNVTPADTWYYGPNSKDGLGLSFAGQNTGGGDIVTASNGATANQFYGSTGYSVDAWVVARSIGANSSGRVVAKSNVAGSGFTFNIGTGNFMRFTGVDNGGVDQVTTANTRALTLNTLTHVAMTWAGPGNTPKIYVDGIECGYSANASIASIADDSAKSLYIGNTGNRTWDGMIDAVRIYRNVTLTPTDVTTIYNAGYKASNPTNNATSQYLFNDGTGTNLADSLGGKDGTISGSDWTNTGWKDDLVAPSNPTTTTATVDGNSITGSSWINQAGTINYQFSGAADADSGVVGYYTYFGTNASADPVTYQAHTGAIGDNQTFSTSTTTADDGKHLYFRVKTKDAIGNISSAATLFDFSYDITLPLKPTSISATPSGYTNTNSFSFSWPAGSDPAGPGGGASGVAGYQYERGGSSGDSWSATQAETSASGIVSYQQGANLFYVRTKDNVGNYSTDYQSVSYYYDTASPTNPSTTALTVGGNSIATSTWTNKTGAVAVTFSGATDALSGLGGYYLYFGTNASADPATYQAHSGAVGDTQSWATGTTISSANDGQTFYLRVKTKDVATNVSSAVSNFTFSYDAVAPTNPTTTTLTVGGSSVASGVWTTLSGATNFVFSGAADVGSPKSDLVGYYTYFGTNASADPATYQAHTGAIGDNQNFNTTTTSADDGKHFYFRVKAKDNAGNISTAVSLFDFGYDITLPIKPTFVAASPAGYTTTNSFTLSWPAGSDPNGAGGGASGVKWYEYKRATDGSWSHTADAATRSVSAVTAYQEGVNTFYARTVDYAGNTSSTYQQVTYYWSGSAPAKPTGLTVSPDTSDSNSFTIHWHKPAVDPGDPPIVGYYYSINATPTIDNVTYVASVADEVSIGPDPFATLQGVNAVYVVSADSAGNLSYESDFVASATFTCVTIAPAIPVSVSLYDSSDRTLDRWILTTQWVAGDGGGATDHYAIYRSTDGYSYSLLATTASTAYIDASGLNNATTYSYRIKAVDNSGKESSPSSVVSKMPTGKYTTPPTILLNPTISDIKSNSVKISWMTDRASTSVIRYAAASSPQAAPLSGSALILSTGNFDNVTNHSVTILGLDPSSKYYFEVQSLDEDRDYDPTIAYSATFNFQTLDAPAISDVKIENITLTTVDISFQTTTVANSTINYGSSSLTTGATINYNKSVEDISGAQTTSHKIKLADLESGTTFHFKIQGTDIDGNYLGSDDYSFTTLSPPKAENIKATPQEGTATYTTKITWNSNVETTTILKYTPKGGAVKESTSSKFSISHEVVLSNILDNTTYILEATGRDQLGNLATSNTLSIETPNDSRPPKIDSLNVESNINGNNADSKSQIIISWHTDELATSQVEYGEGTGAEGYGNSSQEYTNLSNDHLVILSDLSNQKPYHIRAVSKDVSGNLAYSENTIVVTKKPRQAAFTLIMDTLAKSFGFLSKILRF